MELVETWNIHNRINLYLLDSIAEEALAAAPPFRARNAGEQFAHLHNVRLMWLKSAAPDLLDGLGKIEKGEVTRQILKDSLTASGAAIAKLLERGIAEGRIKGFKPHPQGFLGYLISHESHHRGQIALILKACGHPVDKKTSFGLWEWGSR